MRVLNILLCCICMTDVVIGSIDTKLRYYETLRDVDFSVRKRRSLDDDQSHDVHVKFDTLGRHFDVMLKPDASIFADGFKAQILNKDGSGSPLFINKNDFYSGHLADNVSNTVKAHVEDGVWNMVIHTEDDLYAIEPSWRHLSEADQRSMIAYRHSDIKWDHSFPHLANHSNRQKLCQSIHLDPELDGGQVESDEDSSTNHDHQRSKRQTWRMTKNTCKLIVVADYRFHETIGGGFPHRTANYLISLMNKIDNIYRDTLWSNKTGLKGFGFQIQDLRIHEAETIGKLHYNNPKDWATRDLLQVFSQDMYFSTFCLAHLFTYQAFEGGILGLAYIASPRLGTIGGICSSTYKKNRIRHTLNTGFSSSMNSGGNRLLTLESTLVAAHELGHNWGSEHDVDNGECAPSSFHNGKYLMYPYAVNGFEENNLLFSPCSRRYVGAVINAKAYKCFSAKVENIPLCGNGKVDRGEDCDGGEQARNGLDPCCTSQCRFRGGATCSSMNYECCEKCQMASHGFPCRGDSKYSCVKAAVCSGTSLDCPKPEPKNDTTPCLEGGQCFGGLCLSYCEVRDRSLISCQCEGDAKQACRRCCRSRRPGSKCQPEGTAIQMKGRPCYLGFCSEQGMCIKPKSKLVERLFDVIEKLTSSQLVEFMRSNIVGTVIVFSMAIWIPASWAYSCVDKQRQKVERENKRWRSRESQDLFSSLDAASWTIKSSRRIRLNRPGNPIARRQLSQSNPSLTPSMTHETSV
ncbi:ADAM 17-like protease [Gigantopelta aegis]|uniref:ADAM 17-like protease n=1 Tax=Gigantopelta aegis TaxID=1735272 RepID=UPI001B88CB9D|nr:ADAM 17-like protease [Gigantopelta aegis]